MGKLEGKVALVTGSGRNIGRATVLKLAGMLAVSAVCALWVSGARAGAARQRAETAADLAALAAARAASPASLSARQPALSPCAAAADVAHANAGRLVACAVAGEAVEVTVEVESPIAARATAKAGPTR